MVRRVPPHRRASRDTSFWTGCSGISRSACIRNGIIKFRYSTVRNQELP